MGIIGKCSCIFKQYIEGPLQLDGACEKFFSWRKFIFIAGLLFLAFFIGSFVFNNSYADTLSIWQIPNVIQQHASLAMVPISSLTEDTVQSPIQQPVLNTTLIIDSKDTEDHHEEHCVHGIRAFPKGIAEETSDLEMRSLWGDPMEENKRKTPQNLLAIPVGIKQKETVAKMVRKFHPDNFTVMLFHYDGVIDQWSDLQWSSNAIHVAAINQTKWWFAKRFLHPDIVAIYNYIFLWDEDLGVENFNAERYLAIMEKEGLEISQPALDKAKSELHYGITLRNPGSKVHRRMYRSEQGGKGCFENSTAPPCTGWVEMMAPVFSRAAWHCSWNMIQNDLIHGWGLDMKLGYCAQGDRSKNVGVIDSEYIVHQGIPSLGRQKASNDKPKRFNGRVEVRRRAYSEMKIFKERWTKAILEDKCWIDPYGKISTNMSS